MPAQTPPQLPVVVVNGLGAPHVAAHLYARLFRRRGFRAFAVSPAWLGYGDMRAAAARVDATVQQALRETGAEKVILVGMSLGGLIGLYYLKCGGGGPHVDRFISVGGPLNGSRLACYTRSLPGLAHVPVFQQLCADSALHDELERAPMPAGVRMISLGTRGDVITPESLWLREGTERVETPYGIFPLGHWCLFLLPGNHRAVLELALE